MAIDRSKFQMRRRMMPPDLADRDKLTPDHLRGAQFAVVEITHAVQVDAARGENKRTGEAKYEPALVLAFKEFPHNIMWLNKMGVNILCDVYGEEETEWVGKRIPITVKEGVKNPTEGWKVDTLWVAEPDEWQRLFDEDAATREKFAAQKSSATNAAAAAARAAAESGGGKSAKRSAQASTPNVG